VPQSLDRYVYVVNNPLRYVDPTGEDWWNPFAALGAALNAVGQALSKINPLDLLDGIMTVIGFIPGLDIISDAYSMLRAVVDVAMGKGTWADVAMAAVFLLLPVGGSYFKAAKKAANVVEEGASAVRQVGTKVDDLAEGAKGAAKADNVGDAAQNVKSGKSQIDRKEFRNERETFWKEEAKKSSGDYTPENLKRLEEGKPPIGSDGFPMELHHLNGTPTGGLKPMTRTDHRLGGNYQKNHPWLK
jgi:hypothetical protein